MVLWYVNINILFWSGKTEIGLGKSQGILKSDASGNPGRVNPLKPEFNIVIFIHYKLRIAVAILDL